MTGSSMMGVKTEMFSEAKTKPINSYIVSVTKRQNFGVFNTV